LRELREDNTNEEGRREKEENKKKSESGSIQSATVLTLLRLPLVFLNAAPIEEEGEAW
jgi:hypothetical protein